MSHNQIVRVERSDRNVSFSKHTMYAFSGGDRGIELADEMHTAVVELEAIINSHPPTYVSSNDRRTIDTITSFSGMQNFKPT